MTKSALDACCIHSVISPHFPKQVFVPHSLPGYDMWNLCTLRMKKCDPKGRLFLVLYAQSQWTTELPVICWGHSVDCTAAQVKHTVSEVEKAFQRGFCQLTVYFFHSRVWHVLLVKISGFFNLASKTTSQRNSEKVFLEYWLGTGDGVKSKGKWLHFPKALSTTGVSNKGVELLDPSRQKNSPLDSEI